MNPNDVRKMLAGMGAEIQGINRAFQAEDSYGTRASGSDIEAADAMMRRRLGMSRPQPQPVYQNISQPMYQYPSEETYMQPSYDSMYFQEQYAPQPSKSDRLNSYLGRKPKVVQQPVPVTTPRVNEIKEGVSKAIAPLIETVEMLATLNGILVQRIEQLILTVDPDAVIEGVNDTSEKTELIHIDSGTFPEEPIAEMEVYDPEVSMSVIEDEDTPQEAKPKKKTNRKNKA